MDETQADPTGQVADRAMGLELEAVELEAELEWAEAQGRTDDATDIRRRLAATFDELARVVDGAPEAVHVEVHAEKAAHDH